MQNYVRLLLFAVFFFAFLNTFGQADDYFDENFTRFENHIYDKQIKTVQLYRKGWEDTFPIINILEKNEPLRLTFDDLTGDVRNLGYTFIHCTWDWKPSDMLKIEYLNGIEDNPITDYYFSRTMYQQYVSYQLYFPNQDIQFTKSGNYILLVYDMDTNKPLFTWRFFVVEPYVNIVMNIHRATLAQYRRSHHEVDFIIYEDRINLNQPFANTHVVLTQNQRWDNAKFDLKPRFINGNQLDYNYERENIFPAGNQFRFIDIRDVYYRAMRVAFQREENDTFQVYMEPDKVISSRAFLSQGDINGHYYIKNDDPRMNSVLESEYEKVHLALLYPAPVDKAGIYVFGQLTNWNFSSDNRMKYNYEKNAYELDLYLKQGYYDYQYIYVPDGSTVGDVSIIEGSHAEADNEYTVFVYYSEPGQVYDRLIGYRTQLFPDRKGRN